MEKPKFRVFRNLLFLIVLIAAGSIYRGPTPAAAGRAETMLACAAPSDACWQSGFHLPGVLGDVYAVVQAPNGRVYVGGQISRAGGMPVNNLAMWDGVTWHDVGGGVSHTNESAERVSALAADENSNIYVGGWFDQAGSTAASSLAKWNGASWETVGGGVDGSVEVIQTVSGGVYVGGSFSHAGGVAANNIAHYNFSSASWLTLGSGVDSWVTALAYEPGSNSWFVGGDFSTAGGVPAFHLARYTSGGTWEAVGGSMMGGGTVNTLLRLPRDGGGYSLYVGGEFSQAGTNTDVRSIALWDGSTWSALGGGVFGEVKALLGTSPTDLVAAGDISSAGGSPGIPVNNIARWNGSTWSAMGSGVGVEAFEEVNALAYSGASIIAAGRFELSGSLAVNNLARWNGSWASLDGGLGVNNYVNELLADGSGVYVAGDISRFGSLQALGVAKFNGTTWSGGVSPNYSFIRALEKGDSNRLFAGGAFHKTSGANADYIAEWNGAAWQELGGGTNGSVNALAWEGGSGRLYAGGEFTDVGDGNAAAHIAMWDGSAWHALGDGLDGAVRSLALDANGRLYAGGEFTYAGDLYANHIAMWDGSAWHALGAGLSSKYVETLIFDGDNRLVAGGYFGQAGGIAAPGVAMWNGYEWSALGSGLDDGVGALVVDADGYLYAGGDFLNAGGKAANHIARWDGFTWSALGSGTDNPVYELAAVPGRLYAGGGFTSAGGQIAAHFGAYTLPPPVSAPVPQLTAAAPNTVASGGPDFWLTVDGSNFSSRSVVRWNGSPLVTTYVNGGRLKALVPAARIAQSGTASVTVFTPAPLGGGSSSARSVVITKHLAVFLPVVLR